MSSTALGMIASAILVTFMFAMSQPRITPEGDSAADAYWTPSSKLAAARADVRAALAGRSTFQRENLGWKFPAPTRALLFRPCRHTDGVAVDADSDGLVDNLVPANRWRKDWASHNPATADSLWAVRTPAQREAALELARRQMGMGSDFDRSREPAGANCDRQRGSIIAGDYYWPG
ncbi:MAG: hypothetical protein F4Y00_07900 [Bacteroidetes bacterium SB0662_bin_6]|nr:hypothetical protein [Bacteroidetes bacterium SB0662_bin_6]